MNGATCVDGINNFTCNCPPGYSGRHCEINIDDCAPQPCQNGGGCVDGVNLYICNCTDTGFTGDNCEQDIDECAVTPCVNNATCHNLVNDYNCTCWDGFEGKNCETDIPECGSIPCQNNGTCYEKSNLTLYLEDTYSFLSDNIREQFMQGFSYQNASGYICECVPGFQGKYLSQFLVYHSITIPVYVCIVPSVLFIFTSHSLLLTLHSLCTMSLVLA